MAFELPPAIETLVVQPARLPPAAGDTAFSIVQLGPDVLERAPRLDEALTRTPGVSLFRRTSSLGANPTTQGVSVRSIAGSGASRALVTLDGAPQNDPFGGWVIWSAIPPEIVESVRVVRGAGAGPYGAGALTGVISLDETATLPGRGAGEISYGGLGHRRAAAVADLGGGTDRLLLSASAQRSDGWIPIEPGARGAADAPLAFEAVNASARFQTELGAGVLAIRGSAYRETRGGGLVFVDSRSQGWSGTLTLAAAPTPGAAGWRLQAWVRGSDLVNTAAAVTPDRAVATPANDQYATPALGYGFNAALRRAGADLSWELGADLRIAEGEVRERYSFMNGAFTRERVAGGATLVGGAYAEASRMRGDWLLAGGVRLDHWRSSGARRTERFIADGALILDDRPAGDSGLTPTARIGVRRELGSDLSWRAAAYAGFRPATLNELYRPFRVGADITEANAALKPERLYGVETGIAGPVFGAGTWSLGLFHNQLTDAIANVTIGAGPGTFPVAGFVPAGGALRQRRNAGTVNALGLEFDARQPVGRDLTVDLAFGWTRARVDGGAAAPQLTGLRPAQTPRFGARAGVAWRASGPLTLRADLRYESARFDDDLNSRVLAGAATLDARADWRIAGPVVLYAAVDNLTGVEVETAVTGAGVRSFAAPRLIRTGLTFRR